MSDAIPDEISTFVWECVQNFEETVLDMKQVYNKKVFDDECLSTFLICHHFRGYQTRIHLFRRQIKDVPKPAPGSFLFCFVGTNSLIFTMTTKGKNVCVYVCVCVPARA